jgi:hypothetical protein
LKRFISRRGLCTTIYSDNAFTFKRANKDIQFIWNNLINPELHQFYNAKRIKWKFIVEFAPWWGGFYERMVRNVKSCLKKILGRSLISIDEMNTKLIEIEYALNSRPLTYVYNDENEPSAVTPNNFLINGELLTLPDANVDLTKQDLVTKLACKETLLAHFWHRWQYEYLCNLKERTIKNKKEHDMKINDLVLLKDAKQPRQCWRMGKIVELYEGKDGIVRAAKIKVGDSYFKRPLQLLCPLEF